MRFKHSVAVVTGGASGIGLAIVRSLLQEGAYVLVADLAEPAPAALAGFESRLGYCRHDVAQERSWQGVFERLEGEQRSFDLLVNCAGIMQVAELTSTDSSLFERTMAVNAGGVFLGCKHAIRTLLGKGRAGAIVNVASTAAVKPAAWVAAYAASKAAVVNLTRSAALQGAQAPQPIRCNAVLPGVVLTPMVQSMLQAASDPAAALQSLQSQHPLGRLVTGEEVAAAVLFMASAAASGITGASLAVDGGLTAG